MNGYRCAVQSMVPSPLYRGPTGSSPIYRTVLVRTVRCNYYPPDNSDQNEPPFEESEDFNLNPALSGHQEGWPVFRVVHHSHTAILFAGLQWLLQPSPLAYTCIINSLPTSPTSHRVSPLAPSPRCCSRVHHRVAIPTAVKTVRPAAQSAIHTVDSSVKSRDVSANESICCQSGTDDSLPQSPACGRKVQ